MNINYLQTVGPALLAKIPMLLVWLAGIALSVLMIRRGGGKAEKLLLAGTPDTILLNRQWRVPIAAGGAITITFTAHAWESAAPGSHRYTIDYGSSYYTEQ